VPQADLQPRGTARPGASAAPAVDIARGTAPPQTVSESVKTASVLGGKALETAAPVAQGALSAAESLGQADSSTLLTAGGALAAALLLTPALFPLLLE